MIKEEIEILEPFKPILEQKHRYYLYYSGRGTGKSENIIRALLVLALSQKLRMLVIRSTKASLKQSVYASFKEIITNLGLSKYFKFVGDSIRVINGGEIIFMGIKTHNALEVKSIYGVNITFVEEAEGLSAGALQTLLPSVFRQIIDPTGKENSNDLDEGRWGSALNSIIFALNPKFKHDAVWDYFMEHEPPENAYIRKLTEADNPYFALTGMPQQREHDFKILPYSIAKNIWDGELLDFGDDCIFTPKAFEYMTRHDIDSFNRNDYTRIVIGCDPAMTNKDKSNEYGIVVTGLNRRKEMVMIGNYTDSHNPNSFALKVCELYGYYQADEVVVETNQGGDFIKSTILNVNPFVNVKEVRAVRDKVTRATPIANLAALGKIKLLDIGQEKLLVQMKQTTLMGYMGAKGESPDALDAFTWAVFSLGDIGNLQDESSFFNIDKFNNDIKDYGFRYATLRFAYRNRNEVLYMEVDVLENATLRRALNVRKCEKLADMPTDDGEHIMLQDVEANWGYSNATLYEDDNLKLDEKAEEILNYTKKTGTIINIRDCEESIYNNMNENILDTALRRFKINTDKNNMIIEALYYMLKNVS